MTPWRPWVLAVWALLAAAGLAGAQDAPADRFEASGGIRWIGPIHFGDVPANETTFGGGTRPLFTSSSSLDGSIGAAATFGVRLASSVRAELALAFNPTHLSSRVTGDVEGAPDVTIEAPVTQFLIEGGVLVQPGGWRGRRVEPFLTGGAGYLRQLNDGRTLVQSGQSYYVGGGLYYVVRAARPHRLKARGVRVDGRALILRDGVLPDHAARVTPAVTAAFFLRF